jgi:hypothetical protein
MAIVNTTPLFYADGWTPAGEAWAYASASTITVPAGAASRYQKGDKIKLTQTTAKYFYVTVVTDTALTVTGGIDYTVADAAITNPHYSHQSNPLGFPDWFNWTPTLTGGSSDLSGFTTAKFSIKGTVLYFMFWATGKDVTGSAGEIQITLPITGLIAQQQLVYHMYDGSAYNVPLALSLPNQSKINLYKTGAAGSWAASETNVNIAISGFYDI